MHLELELRLKIQTFNFVANIGVIQKNFNNSLQGNAWPWAQAQNLNLVLCTKRFYINTKTNLLFSFRSLETKTL